MTQAEKDKLHIKKQNRRYRNLICRILAPILFLQLLCSPLYIYMFMLRSAVPSEPMEIVYKDSWWVSGYRVRNHLIIQEKTGRQYYVLDHARQIRTPDRSAGRLGLSGILIIPIHRKQSRSDSLRCSKDR